MKLLIWILSFVVFTSCQSQEFKNISVRGKIIDKETKKPIANAEVVALCWYYFGLDDATFIKKSTKTDSQGNYQIKFQKGYQVDIASKTKNYYPNRKYNKIEKNQLIQDLFLEKHTENPTLISVLNTDATVLEINEKTPFLRFRFCKNKDDKTEKVETYGFDMNKMQTTLDLSNADFWFKIEENENQPKIICTNKNGGIIPIKYKDFESSLLYEKNIAPKSGYISEYLLTKEDKGFFVKSKDGKTYGKVIFEDSEIDISSPDGKGGSYKEFGKNFSCLYQPNGTTNLSYQYQDLDLENFLVDGRLQ